MIMRQRLHSDREQSAIPLTYRDAQFCRAFREHERTEVEEKRSEMEDERGDVQASSRDLYIYYVKPSTM
jgi:hypothetical protein